jgi:hypothetical protein
MRARVRDTDRASRGRVPSRAVSPRTRYQVACISYCTRVATARRAIARRAIVMGACCAKPAREGEDDVDAPRARLDAFHDARHDAFEIDWNAGIVSDAAFDVARARREWCGHAAALTTEDARASDADRLAALGELEAALWMDARAREAGRATDVAPTARSAAWRDVYEQAIALNDIELEEHHDGWKPVDKGAKRAARHRRQSSVDVDAEVIIGANHSRRAASVDYGSRRTSSVDFGRTRASEVGTRRTSSIDLGRGLSQRRTLSVDFEDANVARRSLRQSAASRDVEVSLGRTDSEKRGVIDFGEVSGLANSNTVTSDGEEDPLAPRYRRRRGSRHARSGSVSSSDGAAISTQRDAVSESESGGENSVHGIAGVPGVTQETFEDDPDLDERLVMYYGRFKGGTVHSIKLSATFDAPPHRLVAIAREWDLMTLWNVYAIETSIMLVRGLTHLVVYSAIWLPWPLSARDKIIVIDSTFVGQPPKRAYDHLKIPGIEEFESEVPHSCAILLTRTNKPGDDLGTGAPPSAKSRKRIEFVGNCGMRMRALPPARGSKSIRTRGDVVVHADVKMRFIPATVVRFVLRVMAPWVHRMIDKMLKSPKYFGASDSLFQPRIDANPDLYRMVRRRLGEPEFDDVVDSEIIVGDLARPQPRV